MKSFASIVAVALFAFQDVAAFSSFTGSQLKTNVVNSGSITMEYIPSGISKEQWKKMKENEKSKKSKDLGKSGITTFKSRSFSDWQKAGGKNLFPVDPKSVKRVEDLPYMQRPGGMADGSDLKDKKKSGSMFNFGGKKKAPEPEPEKKKNWWGK